MASDSQDLPGRQESTAALARMAASQDGQAFNSLYERIAPAVFSWARLRVGQRLQSRLDPEDVVQEVWYRALRRFGEFDEARGSFRRWIFGIANNVMLEFFRGLGRQPFQGQAHDTSVGTMLGALPDEATSISRRVSRDQELHELVQELSTLDQQDRSLLLYRGLEGLSHAEVGRILGIAGSAAAKRWQRLQVRLQSMKIPQDLISR